MTEAATGFSAVFSVDSTGESTQMSDTFPLGSVRVHQADPGSGCLTDVEPAQLQKLMNRLGDVSIYGLVEAVPPVGVT